MSQDKELELKIKKWANQEEELPESIKKKTALAYEEIRAMGRKSKHRNKKKWSAVAAGILLIGVISIQPPVLAGIKKVLFGGDYVGVQLAIDKGELQEIEGAVSESNGIKLEVIGGLIDPTVIHLRLKLSTENPKLLKNFRYNPQHSWRFIDQFTIIDDQGRIIQSINEEGSYSEPIRSETDGEIWMLSSSVEEVDSSKKEQGEIYIDMILNSSEGNYKEIKGITLQTHKLGKFEGDWSLKVNFNEDMNADEGINYQVVEAHEAIQIVDATLYRTGLKVDFITSLAIDESVISKAQIINETGQVYTSDRTGWMEQVEGGEKVVLTFGILAEDLGENFSFKIDGFEGGEVKFTLGAK